MLEIQGYQLDSKNFLAELEDRDGKKSWWPFEFANDIVNGTVDCDVAFQNKSLWNMKQIDPNDFEWNGRRMRLLRD